MKTGSKWVSGMVAASLLWTGMTWSTSTVSAASPFSDVKANHWAEKHITKLALQGILKGGTNGKFNPSNAVTRQEAVIIALRFMGVADEVKLSDVLVFPSSLVIKEDYKPYIKLAVQKKILMIDEEVALAEKEQGKEWGKSPATREWMTRLLVRAIGKDAEAKLASAQATSFGDDAKIDVKLKGYVNVAVSSGLVTGVTATKFDPLASVTREMASTLFSRAESKIEVAYSGQVNGVLLSSSATQMTLLHSDGVVKDYKLSPNASIYGFGSDQITALSNLKQYGEVFLVSYSDGSIGYVEQTNETAKVKTYEGTLTRVSTSLNRLTVLIGEDSNYYYYDPQHLPAITDSNGQAVALSDLPVNVNVKILVDAVRTDGKIVSVAVKQSVTNKSGAGTVSSWNSATHSLQVKDSVTGNIESLAVNVNAIIKKDGVNIASEDMKVGDTISYEVKTGSVTSIVVTKSQKSTISGVLNAIDKTDKTIQFTLNNNLEAEYLADNVAVKIDGFAEPTLDDLYKGDAVTLTLNDSGKVSLITVTGRTVKSLVAATINSYVVDAKTLIVFDAAGTKYNLDVNASTRFDLNGTKLTLDAAIPFITAKGKKINIGYSGTNVVYVSIIAKYSGTVTENNTSAKTLKLAIDSTNNITIGYSSPIVEIYGQNSETYSDIRIGDQVTVLLNAFQDQAASILVQKNAQFEFVSSDLTGNKLRAKRADGVVEEWTLASTVALQDENGAAIALNALNSASLLNVTFQGNTPVKIKAVSVTYGRVLSVNTANASIDIVTSLGVAVTKPVGTTPIIMRDNVVLSSLTTVQPDDRVEIRKDENDRVVIQIVPVLRKIFWYAEIDTRTINVKKETLTDTNFYFTVHPTAYIHQGTTTLSLADLRNDDAISLYILRGKVVEIAR
ncbi:S-layer homology domain-containing protein [Cohnella luojiensis]|uniref:S-layer homology domain-containing protein n=1 Tax=Cohnella luojiensis TaxID=652876 RepID=A0A4Y8M450_9BACL|nr:S-layer homology domain-containing protein [Cohnella luojiensis]TFE30063.1 S-layer homology domain-containing protein [Cohnella luojiensis]